jgi:hypothetical protein
MKKWLQNLLFSMMKNFKFFKRRQLQYGRTLSCLICLKDTAKVSSSLKGTLTIIHSSDMTKFHKFSCNRH